MFSSPRIPQLPSALFAGFRAYFLRLQTCFSPPRSFLVRHHYRTGIRQYVGFSARMFRMIGWPMLPAQKPRPPSTNRFCTQSTRVSSNHRPSIARSITRGHEHRVFDHIGLAFAIGVRCIHFSYCSIWNVITIVLVRRLAAMISSLRTQIIHKLPSESTASLTWQSISCTPCVRLRLVLRPLSHD